MRILLCAPTVFEIAGIIDFLDVNGSKLSFSKYEYLGHTIEVFVTGVGSIQTTYGMSQLDTSTRIDYAIQVGLAGAFTKSLSLGDVVIVESDTFADIGVEESDGTFLDIYALELANKDMFPFKNGLITNDSRVQTPHRKVTAITVNTVSGAQQTIDRRKQRFQADIETMEGAAFFYCCKMQEIPCLQVRAISNFVEPRNKDNWEIDLALTNLKIEFIRIFQSL